MNAPIRVIPSPISTFSTSLVLFPSANAHCAVLPDCLLSGKAAVPEHLKYNVLLLSSYLKAMLASLFNDVQPSSVASPSPTAKAFLLPSLKSSASKLLENCEISELSSSSSVFISEVSSTDKETSVSSLSGCSDSISSETSSKTWTSFEEAITGLAAVNAIVRLKTIAKYFLFITDCPRQPEFPKQTQNDHNLIP